MQEPNVLIGVLFVYIQIKPLLIHLVLAFHEIILTIYLISIIYFTYMLPQHPVYRNELNCECFNVTLARNNVAP